MKKIIALSILFIVSFSIFAASSTKQALPMNVHSAKDIGKKKTEEAAVVITEKRNDYFSFGVNLKFKYNYSNMTGQIYDKMSFHHFHSDIDLTFQYMFANIGVAPLIKFSVNPEFATSNYSIYVPRNKLGIGGKFGLRVKVHKIVHLEALFTVARMMYTDNWNWYHALGADLVAGVRVYRNNTCDIVVDAILSYRRTPFSNEISFGAGIGVEF